MISHIFYHSSVSVFSWSWWHEERKVCRSALHCRNWDVNASMSWNKNIFLEKKLQDKYRCFCLWRWMSCCSYCCRAAVMWNVGEEMNENGSDKKQMYVGKITCKKLFLVLLSVLQSYTVNPFKLFTSFVGPWQPTFVLLTQTHAHTHARTHTPRVHLGSPCYWQ